MALLGEFSPGGGRCARRLTRGSYVCIGRADLGSAAGTGLPHRWVANRAYAPRTQIAVRTIAIGYAIDCRLIELAAASATASRGTAAIAAIVTAAGTLAAMVQPAKQTAAMTTAGLAAVAAVRFAAAGWFATAGGFAATCWLAAATGGATTIAAAIAAMLVAQPTK